MDTMIIQDFLTSLIDMTFVDVSIEGQTDLIQSISKDGEIYKITFESWCRKPSIEVPYWTKLTIEENYIEEFNHSSYR